MPAVTFDTLKFANQLKTAGVPVIHAEAEAKALSEVFETNLGELATKEDLHHEIDGLRHETKELETSLRHEMKELETGLRHEIRGLETSLHHEMSDLRKDMDIRFAGVDTKLEKLELRMTIKLGSIVVVALGAFTVIFKFL